MRAVQDPVARCPGQRGSSRGGPSRAASGQATAEFALVIGILIFIMLGVVDLGRLVAMQSAAVTASREGARYGSATGADPLFGGHVRYVNCAGIKNAATLVSKALVPANSIAVTWDAGPSTAQKHDCTNANVNPAPSAITSLDRVRVQVTATFTPVSAVRFVIPSITVQSTDRRTIVKP